MQNSLMAPEFEAELVIKRNLQPQYESSKVAEILYNWRDLGESLKDRVPDSLNVIESEGINDRVSEIIGILSGNLDNDFQINFLRDILSIDNTTLVDSLLCSMDQTLSRKPEARFYSEGLVIALAEYAKLNKSYEAAYLITNLFKEAKDHDTVSRVRSIIMESLVNPDV